MKVCDALQAPGFPGERGPPASGDAKEKAGLALSRQPVPGWQVPALCQCPREAVVLLWAQQQQVRAPPVLAGADCVHVGWWGV